MLLVDELNCSDPTRSWRDIHVNTVCTGAIRMRLLDNLSIKFAEENHCSVVITGTRRMPSTCGAVLASQKRCRGYLLRPWMPRVSAQAPIIWWTEVSWPVNRSNYPKHYIRPAWNNSCGSNYILFSHIIPELNKYSILDVEIYSIPDFWRSLLNYRHNYLDRYSFSPQYVPLGIEADCLAACFSGPNGRSQGG